MLNASISPRVKDSVPNIIANKFLGVVDALSETLPLKEVVAGPIYPLFTIFSAAAKFS